MSIHLFISLSLNIYAAIPKIPVAAPIKQIRIINKIILVGGHDFFPKSQYTNNAKQTGSNPGMILSNIPFCKDKETLPVANFNGV